jgi:hypothetical protein
VILPSYPCSKCLRSRLVFFTGKRWLCRGCWGQEFPDLTIPEERGS